MIRRTISLEGRSSKLIAQSSENLSSRGRLSSLEGWRLDIIHSLDPRKTIYEDWSRRRTRRRLISIRPSWGAQHRPSSALRMRTAKTEMNSATCLSKLEYGDPVKSALNLATAQDKLIIRLD